MKTTKLGVAILTLGALAMSPLFAEEAKPEAASAPTTASGEVLDMVCYLDHGAQGEKHKKCAQGCLDGGAPAGLLKSDGSVVLLLEDHKNPKALKEVRSKAGEQVTVKGKLVKRGGVEGIIVQ